MLLLLLLWMSRRKLRVAGVDLGRPKLLSCIVDVNDTNNRGELLVRNNVRGALKIAKEATIGLGSKYTVRKQAWMELGSRTYKSRRRKCEFNGTCPSVLGKRD